MSIEDILNKIEGKDMTKEASDEELQKIASSISDDLIEEVFEATKEKLAKEDVILGGTPKAELSPEEMFENIVKEKTASANLEGDKAKLFNKLAKLTADKFKVVIDDNFEQRTGAVEGPDMFNQTVPDEKVNQKEG